METSLLRIYAYTSGEEYVTDLCLHLWRGVCYKSMPTATGLCLHQWRRVCYGSMPTPMEGSLLRIHAYTNGGEYATDLCLHLSSDTRRTNNQKLSSHLKRIGVKTSAQCPCGNANQTPEHYLQSCSLQQQARQQIWPNCVSLKTKLWGSAEDLFLTSKYVALAEERI